MKKSQLIATIIVAAAFGGSGQAQTPSPTVSPKDGGGTRCEQNSSSVSVYRFYGTKEVLTQQVTDLPAKLSERRVFVQVTQSGRQHDKLTVTDVRLFEERKGSGGFSVTQWKKGEVPTLLDELDQVIIKNKGTDCVGDAMKKVINKRLGEGKELAPLAPLSSPRDTFGPAVQEATTASEGDVITTTVIFGC